MQMICVSASIKTKFILQNGRPLSGFGACVENVADPKTESTACAVERHLSLPSCHQRSNSALCGRLIVILFLNRVSSKGLMSLFSTLSVMPLSSEGRPQLDLLRM